MEEGHKQRQQHEKRHGGAERLKSIQGKVSEIVGLPGSSAVKNPPANSGDLGSIPGLGRSPEEGKGIPLMFLPGESHGQRSLVGYSPWGHKESDTTEQLSNTTGEIMAKSLSLLKSVIGELWGRVV